MMEENKTHESSELSNSDRSFNKIASSKDKYREKKEQR